MNATTKAYVLADLHVARALIHVQLFRDDPLRESLLAELELAERACRATPPHAEPEATPQDRSGEPQSPNITAEDFDTIWALQRKFARSINAVYSAQELLDETDPIPWDAPLPEHSDTFDKIDEYGDIDDAYLGDITAVKKHEREYFRADGDLYRDVQALRENHQRNILKYLNHKYGINVTKVPPRYYKSFGYNSVLKWMVLTQDAFLNDEIITNTTHEEAADNLRQLSDRISRKGRRVTLHNVIRDPHHSDDGQDGAPSRTLLDVFRALLPAILKHEELTSIPADLRAEIAHDCSYLAWIDHGTRVKTHLKGCIGIKAVWPHDDHSYGLELRFTSHMRAKKFTKQYDLDSLIDATPSPSTPKTPWSNKSAEPQENNELPSATETPHEHSIELADHSDKLDLITAYRTGAGMGQIARQGDYQIQYLLE